ncbi:hypothetical protein V2J09_010140 [Rumex salicifolius]
MASSSSAAAASLSYIPRSSTSFSSSLPFHAGLSRQTFLLKSKPKSPKSLNLTSKSLSLRLLSPAGFFRTASSSEELYAAGEDEDEEELELSGSETDQLLEQEHEEEQDGEEEEEGEGEIKKVASSEDGRLYVGNLPFSTTTSQLTEIFVEAGAVRSVEIIYDRVTDRSRGFAFVTMETVEDAENAIRMFDSTQIGGRAVKVNFPEVPKGGERKVLETKIKTSYKSFVDTPNNVYAGNLSWSLTQQGLRDAFSKQPGFVSAKVMFERGTGKPRGFGFVSFSSPEEARSAITAMNGVELEGRSLRLNMASERARSPPSSAVSSSEESVEETEILSGVSS